MLAAMTTAPLRGFLVVISKVAGSKTLLQQNASVFMDDSGKICEMA